MDANKIPSPRELELLSLVVDERTGREVAKLYEAKTRNLIPYGTLYVLFAQFEEAGWVRINPATSGDRRIRRIQIIGAGKRALARGIKHYRALAEFGESAGGWGAS